MQNSFFRLCLLVLALIGGASACSGGGSSSEGIGGAGGVGGIGGSGTAAGGSGGTNVCSTQGVAEADLPDVFAHTVCDNIGPCCANIGSAYDAPACTANARDVFIKSFSVKIKSVPGTTYDPVQACLCIEIIRQQATTCVSSPNDEIHEIDDADKPGSPCYGVYKPPVGTTPLGGDCQESYECASDGKNLAICDYCALDGGTKNFHCGLSTVVADGEHCDWQKAECKSVPKAFCASASFCDQDTSTCKKGLNLGEKCNPMPYNCADGLYCGPGNVCTQDVPRYPVDEKICKGTDWG
ncbi:MAG: hypothetical protein WC750_02940 [Patescibacteria group bacterium]